MTILYQCKFCNFRTTHREDFAKHIAANHHDRTCIATHEETGKGLNYTLDREYKFPDLNKQDYTAHSPSGLGGE